MKIHDEFTLSLDNFEGPLALLCHLVQKSEIDIYEISLLKITDQFLQLLMEEESKLEVGAEFISNISTLLFLKSQSLLPKQKQITEEEKIELELDPNFDIIHHLVDYCRFKQAAKTLVEREQQQNSFHLRGTEGNIEIKKNLGIEHLTLDDLALLFKEIASKAVPQIQQVHEEPWKVSDKIAFLRSLLKDVQQMEFSQIFSEEMSRLELIVTFLAILELMKLGEISIVRASKARDIQLNKILLLSNKNKSKNNPE